MKESYDLALQSLRSEILFSSVCRMSSAKILVTGATGFVGKSLLYILKYFIAFHRINFQVFVLIGNSNQEWLKSKYPEFITLRIENLGVKFILSDFDFVFHLANSNVGMTSPSFKPEHSVAYSILKRLLTSLKSTSEVRILLSSSGAVYGSYQIDAPGPLAENIPIKSTHLGPYAMTKLRCEELLLHSSSSQVSPIVCRLFSFYGPHLPINSNFAIGNFFRDSIEGKTIRILGTGSSVRSYLSSYDLASALVTIITSDFEGVINVGGQQSITIMELAELFLDLTRTPKTRLEVLCDKSVKETFYLPSTHILNQRIGFFESIELKHGIEYWIASSRQLGA